MMRFLAAPLAALAIIVPAAAQQGAMRSYDKAAFDQAVRSGQPVLVHVHADWCPTCRRQQPILNSLLREPANARLQAFVVNFDTETAFRQANRVTSQSTLIVFKGGQEAARSTGATDEAAISNLLARAR